MATNATRWRALSRAVLAVAFCVAPPAVHAREPVAGPAVDFSPVESYLAARGWTPSKIFQDGIVTGHRALSRGDFAAAAQRYGAAALADPRHPGGGLLFGYALHLMGRHRRASAIFQDAFLAFPFWERVSVNLSGLLPVRERANAARRRRELRDMAREPGASAAVRAFPALLCYFTARPRSARLLLDAAVDADRRAPALRYLDLLLRGAGYASTTPPINGERGRSTPEQTGMNLLAAGRFREAAFAFLEARFIQPKNAAARLGLAVALALDGRERDAGAVLATAVLESPALLDDALRIGHAAGKTRVEKTLRRLEAESEDPGAPSRALVIATLCALHGDQDRGLRALNAAKPATPATAALRDALSALQLGPSEDVPASPSAKPRETAGPAARNPGGAAASPSSSSAADRETTAPLTHNELLRAGELWFAQGNYREAESAYAGALRESPVSVEAHLGLARTALAQERFVSAGGRLREAMDLSPRTLPAGRWRSVLGDTAYARTSRALQEWIDRFPRDPQARFLLAYLRYEADDREGALLAIRLHLVYHEDDAHAIRLRRALE